MSETYGGSGFLYMQNYGYKNDLWGNSEDTNAQTKKHDIWVSLKIASTLLAEEFHDIIQSTSQDAWLVITIPNMQ